MQLKVVAIAIVEASEVDVLGASNPATGFVVDEDSADPLSAKPPLLKECLNLRDREIIGAAGFQPVDQAGDDRLGEFERVIGMLRKRTSQVGHVHLGILHVSL